MLSHGTAGLENRMVNWGNKNWTVGSFQETAKFNPTNYGLGVVDRPCNFKSANFKPANMPGFLFYQYFPSPIPPTIWQVISYL